MKKADNEYAIYPDDYTPDGTEKPRSGNVYGVGIRYEVDDFLSVISDYDGNITIIDGKD